MCDNKRRYNYTAVEKGIGFGSCLAMIISYTAYKSIGWAIIHGIFGWLYVVYYYITYAEGLM